MDSLNRSLAERLASLPQQQRRQVLERLSPGEGDRLEYDWGFWSRPKQRAPAGDWSIWLILAGRGAGKTRCGAEWVRSLAEGNLARRIAIVAPTAADARKVCVEGESGLLAISPPSFRPIYQPSQRQLTWPNGVIATLYSGEEPERLRGPQHSAAWCLTGDTRILMGDGSEKLLADVRAGDFVATRIGSRRVSSQALTKRKAEIYSLAVADGRTIQGTADHPVWICGRGFVPFAKIVGGMRACVINASIGAEDFGTRNPRTRAARSITWRTFIFTGKYGKQFTAQLQRALTSITRMATSSTIASRIWNYCRIANTAPCIWRKRSGLIGPKRRQGQSQLLRAIARFECSAVSHAHNVALASIAAPFTRQSFALLPALEGRGPAPIVGKAASANFAALNISPPKERKGIAQRNVTTEHPGRACQLRRDGSSVHTAKGHSRVGDLTRVSAATGVPAISTQSIVTVEKLATRRDVYDIAVDEAREFFANGILVHNCDELAAWARMRETFDMLQFGLRIGARPRQVITTTPKPLSLLKEILARPDSVITRGSTSENAANLAPAFLRTIVDKYQGTRLGRQELDGELIEEVEGALWTRAMIERARLAGPPPPMRRVVIGIDPAVSAKAESNLTGIIAAGLGQDNRGYVLADGSGRYSPDGWARKAVALYDSLKADRFIAEGNQGGDMVRHTINSVRPNAPVTIVHASRAKMARAEPIAALYEQNKISHCGVFPELEDQQCSWEPLGDMPSPDRLDAMVWAFTALMLNAPPVMTIQNHGI